MESARLMMDGIGKRFRLSARARRQSFAWICLTPILLFFAIFWIYPILSAFFISLNDWGLLTGPGSFLGLENYRSALDEPLFWRSLGNTAIYVVIFVGVTIVTSLLAALFVVSLPEPWKAIMMTIYFIPTITSMVVAALVFEVMYVPSYGVLNYLLSLVGLNPVPWTTSDTLIMPSVALFMIWKNFGFYMVLFVTGLYTIPQEIIEASAMDGANSWQRLWHIKLPLLRPILTFNFVTASINAFQVFGPVYVLGRSVGGRDAARTLVLHLYRQAFQYFEVGQATATAFLLFLLILGFAIFQMRLLREQFEY